ncbi:class I SAM-dependent methyltransferase [Streptomyces sp. SBT349]|uniref:class I SAM-dependent methyltransferase n=1 Tax=Streptomyces sp. SBT349 TaxID=1580539 RepID=UPI0018FE98BD|nr:class I SAM-dependent methyltransferase [Streptomyces sp. SBT349]
MITFGAVADAYERGRPSYPAAAVDWLLAETGPRVLDLGAGTGKLTRLLTDRERDVTAVEPSDGMRELLTSRAPGARVLAGVAESIPLCEGSVDVVLMAQAWHWVDPERALPETARVLAPGGTLGLVWNVRDDREDWTARLGRLLHPGGPPPAGHATAAALGDRPDLYGPAEAHTVEWRYAVDAARLADLVASRSYVIAMADDERTTLLREVADLAAHHPALAGRDVIEMPYVTHCYRARRHGVARDRAAREEHRAPRQG